MRSTRRFAVAAVLPGAMILSALFFLLVGTSETAASTTDAHIALPSDIRVNGGHLWVANGSLSKNSPLDNSVSEFDTSSGSLVRVISMVHITGTSNSPNAIAVSGAHVWVADLNTVIELNAFNGSVVRVIKVKAQFHSFESPNSVGALAVAGGHVWVANLNTVVELNASNGSVVRVIDAKTDQLRQLMHIAVSGSHVWVLNNDVGDLVTELNASKGSVTRDISFHSVVGFIGPGSIATDNGRLWVTNDNSVIQLNASNGKVMRVIKAKADGFDDPEAMTADGPHLRVTNTQGNSVTELHVSDGSLARVFR